MTRTKRATEMTDAELEAYANVIGSDDYAPGVVDVIDVAALRAVSDAADAARTADAATREAVELARAGGWSWTRIGVALGVSRQAARQRFGTPVDH